MDAYFVGAVLSDVVLSNGWVGSREERTDRQWAMVHEEYKKIDKPVRLSVLRFSMFTRAMKFAALKANAMEVHHLLLTLPALLRRISDNSLRQHRFRLRACEDLVNIHKVFSDSDVHLSEAASKKGIGLAV